MAASYVYPDTSFVLNLLLPDDLVGSKKKKLALGAREMLSKFGSKLAISRLTVAEIATACPNILRRHPGIRGLDPVKKASVLNSEKKRVVEDIFKKLYDELDVRFVSSIQIDQKNPGDQLARILLDTRIIPVEFKDSPSGIRWTSVDDLIHFMTADCKKLQVFLTFDKMTEHLAYKPKNGLRTVVLDTHRHDESLQVLEASLKACSA